MNLKEYLFFKRMPVTEFSQIMDYSRTHISAVISGKANASRKLSERIEKFTEGEIKASDLRSQVKRNKINVLENVDHVNDENSVEII